MSKDTKNTKLWKLFEQRDNGEKQLFYKKFLEIDIRRNDCFDSEIDKLLRD